MKTTLRFIFPLFLLIGCKAEQAQPPTEEFDVFGLKTLYSSKTGAKQWTSLHWANVSYTIDNRIDEQDPSSISGRRGTGTASVDNGVLDMGGSQPRLYIYPMPNQAAWQNVEVTMYYKRIEDADTDWAGAIIGVRSGNEGHATEPCDAHTYYARIRQDGTLDFAKELKHSDSAATAKVAQDIAWPEALDLPFNTWIGIKYIAYNNDSGNVVLELYRDMSEGKDGGNWMLINSHVDDGSNWPALTDCSQHQPNSENTSYQASLNGGAVLIRNTDITSAEYKWVSVREITP